MSDLVNKTMAMLRYNHNLIKKYKREFKFGIGNCNAEFVFVVREFSYEFVFFLERLLPKFNLEVSDVYITPFYKLKTNKTDFMLKIFQKEIQIINPVKIILAEEIQEIDRWNVEVNIIYCPELIEVINLEKAQVSKKQIIKKQKKILKILNPILSEEEE